MDGESTIFPKVVEHSTKLTIGVEKGMLTLSITMQGERRHRMEGPHNQRCTGAMVALIPIDFAVPTDHAE